MSGTPLLWVVFGSGVLTQPLFVSHDLSISPLFAEEELRFLVFA